MGVAAELGVLALLVFVTPLSAIFGTEPFDPIYWWAVVAVTFIVLIAEELRKWGIRYFEKR
jgi:hypothetical protein